MILRVILQQVDDGVGPQSDTIVRYYSKVEVSIGPQSDTSVR